MSEDKLIIMDKMINQLGNTKKNRKSYSFFIHPKTFLYNNIPSVYKGFRVDVSFIIPFDDIILRPLNN